jgi:CheY-like chemotaxis protein
MPPTIRALILEDQDIWQYQHEHSLGIEAGRCQAWFATTVDAAIALLQEVPFHVVIIDLQLKTTEMPKQSLNEFEGYRLVRTLRDYGWLDKMVVCVVSGWSDIRRLENFQHKSAIEMDTARLSFSYGIEVADVIYFSKDQYQHEVFWKRIKAELNKKELFTEHLPQQRDIIDILAHRMTRNMIEHIESNSDHSRLAKEDEWLRDFYINKGEEGLNLRLKLEISDLLMRWSRKAEGLKLSAIGSGFSKASVIKASRKARTMWQLPVIIKMAYHREIAGERNAYNETVHGSLKRVPHAQDGPRTFLLDAQIYDFVDEGKSFEEVYHQGNISVDELESLVDDLFKNCENWYQASYQHMAKADEYMRYLHCYPKRFQYPLEILETLEESEGEVFWDVETICFPSISAEFESPLRLLKASSHFPSKFIPAMYGFTHGDFNANNILVRQNQTWLIDFGRTEECHAMRDFIQLEAVVKFVLLRGASLQERYELEQVLIQQRRFDDIQHLRTQYQPTGANARLLERAFRLVCKIREKAWEVVLAWQTNSPVGDFEQYEMGLFFLSLNSVRFVKTNDIPDGIEPIQALHALLAASMLGQKF